MAARRLRSALRESRDGTTSSSTPAKGRKVGGAEPQDLKAALAAMKDAYQAEIAGLVQKVHEGINIIKEKNKILKCAYSFIVTQSNSKYRTMLNARMDTEDKLQAEISSLRTCVERLQKEHTLLTEINKAMEKEKHLREKKFEELSHLHTSAAESADSMMREIMKLRKDEEAAREHANAVEKRVTALQNHKTLLEENLEQLEKSMARELNTRDQEIKQLQANTIAISKLMKEEQQRLVEEGLAKAKERLQGAEGRITTLSEELNTARVQITTLSSQLNASEQRNSKLAEKVTRLENTHATALKGQAANYNNETRAMRQELSRLSSGHINEMKHLRNSLEGVHEKALKELEARHERQIANLKAAHQQAQIALNRNHATECVKPVILLRDHNSKQEIDALRVEWEEERGMLDRRILGEKQSMTEKMEEKMRAREGVARARRQAIFRLSRDVDSVRGRERTKEGDIELGRSESEEARRKDRVELQRRESKGGDGDDDSHPYRDIDELRQKIQELLQCDYVRLRSAIAEGEERSRRHREAVRDAQAQMQGEMKAKEDRLRRQLKEREEALLQLEAQHSEELARRSNEQKATEEILAKSRALLAQQKLKEDQLRETIRTYDRSKLADKEALRRSVKERESVEETLVVVRHDLACAQEKHSEALEIVHRDLARIKKQHLEAEEAMLRAKDAEKVALRDACRAEELFGRVTACAPKLVSAVNAMRTSSMCSECCEPLRNAVALVPCGHCLCQACVERLLLEAREKKPEEKDAEVPTIAITCPDCFKSTSGTKPYVPNEGMDALVSKCMFAHQVVTTFEQLIREGDDDKTNS
eukprot:jgi/Bigna1/71558/fgenesh1_pg.16_\